MLLMDGDGLMAGEVPPPLADGAWDPQSAKSCRNFPEFSEETSAV